MNVVDTDIEVLQDFNARTHIIYAVGRTQMHAVVLDKNGDGAAVKLRSLPLTTWWTPPGTKRQVEVSTRAHMRLRQLFYQGKPYPLKRAVRTLRRAGECMGITDGARAVLAELKEIA